MKKEKINKIKSKKMIISIISLVIFIIITFLVFNNKINFIDETVYNYMVTIQNSSLTNIMITITNISGAYCLLVITTLLFAIIKNKKIPLILSINLICSFLTSQIFKLIISRNRPDNSLISVSGFSYPSGHALVSMAYYGLIAYLIYKKVNNKVMKTLLIITIIFMILTIGISRIYLGVHYLSDIIGGFLLSISYLLIFINIISNKVKL